MILVDTQNNIYITDFTLEDLKYFYDVYYSMKLYEVLGVDEDMEKYPGLVDVINTGANYIYHNRAKFNKSGAISKAIVKVKTTPLEDILL